MGQVFLLSQESQPFANSEVFIHLAALVAMLPSLGRPVFGLVEGVLRGLQHARNVIYGLVHISFI